MVKRRAWQEPFLHNTIDMELEVKENVKHFIEWGREISLTELSDREDAEGEERIEFQLPEGVEMDYYWSWAVEEFDLVPTSANASARYVAACGL